MAKPRAPLSALTVDRVRAMTDQDLKRMRQAKTGDDMALFIHNFLNPPAPQQTRFSPYASGALAGLQQVLRRLEEAADDDERKELLADARWASTPAAKVLVGFLAEDSRRLAALERYVEKHLEMSYWTTASDVQPAPKKERKPRKQMSLTPEQREQMLARMAVAREARRAKLASARGEVSPRVEAGVA